jgi:hypothetical protein
MIQRPEATRPNNIPKGSTVKLMFRPGNSLSSVRLGLSPAITAGVREATTRNNITAVVSVTVSRKLGILLVIKIPADPIKGIKMAQRIEFSSVKGSLRSEI